MNTVTPYPVTTTSFQHPKVYTVNATLFYSWTGQDIEPENSNGLSHQKENTPHSARRKESMCRLDQIQIFPRSAVCRVAGNCHRSNQIVTELLRGSKPVGNCMCVCLCVWVVVRAQKERRFLWLWREVKKERWKGEWKEKEGWGGVKSSLSRVAWEKAQFWASRLYRVIPVIHIQYATHTQTHSLPCAFFSWPEPLSSAATHVLRYKWVLLIKMRGYFSSGFSYHCFSLCWTQKCYFEQNASETCSPVVLAPIPPPPQTFRHIFQALKYFIILHF